MPFLSNIGTTELIIIGVILLFLFGGKVLSGWAKGLGQTGHELKKVKDDFNNALSNGSDSPKKKKETK